MALPSSGQLSLGNIRTELGISGVTNFSLASASVGGIGPYPSLNSYSFSKPTSGVPHGISEWYRYDHSIGYVEITFTTTQFQCSPTDVVTYGYQYIEYFNKSGISVSSPYNISINGVLALPINSIPGPYQWNQYEYNDCDPSQSYGAYINPTSVVITGTSTKVWVSGTGFL